MRIVLVGQLCGTRRVRWGGAILASFLAGTVGALGAVVASYALSWPLSPLALMIGFTGGIIAVGTGVVRAFQLPIEQLPLLDR